jgi:crotonobetainyl-CoA:carnitine CoA-transferase CaiB-like acyl-CoA transferase
VHGELLSVRTQQWCAVLSTDEALAHLGEARIPAGPVLTPRQTLEHEQVRGGGMLQDVAHPHSAVPVPVAAPAFLLGETPMVVQRRAPLLGEHTDEVLRGVGYTDTEIAALRAQRTI